MVTVCQTVCGTRPLSFISSGWLTANFVPYLLQLANFVNQWLNSLFYGIFKATSAYLEMVLVVYLLQLANFVNQWLNSLSIASLSHIQMSKNGVSCWEGGNENTACTCDCFSDLLRVGQILDFFCAFILTST